MFKVPEEYRLGYGPLASTHKDKNNGCFLIPFESYQLQVIASDGLGWDHVSVSLNTRCPNWKEMCFVKDLFWDSEDCVVQYHPPKKDYINVHNFCLHLWRPQGQEIPQPDKIMVGF